MQESWCANLASNAGPVDLQAHQAALAAQGIVVRASQYARPPGDAYYAPSVIASLERVGPILDAVEQATLQPTSWQGRGPLPTHADGLRQVQVVQAIIESARTGHPVTLP